MEDIGLSTLPDKMKRFINQLLKKFKCLEASQARVVALIKKDR